MLTQDFPALFSGLISCCRLCLPWTNLFAVLPVTDPAFRLRPRVSDPSGFCQLVSAQLLVAFSWYVCLNSCLPAYWTGVPSLSPWTFPVPRETVSCVCCIWVLITPVTVQSGQKWTQRTLLRRSPGSRGSKTHFSNTRKDSPPLQLTSSRLR